MTVAGVRILVVDDDPELLELMEMRLVAEGYLVSLATSGEEALARFRADRPRVVISDLRMDGMDGHALFAHLHAEAPTVPVIMLTAHGTIPDAVNATRKGVFGFLTKPFDGRELMAKVAEAVLISPQVEGSPGAESTWRCGLVATSGIMDELLRQAHRAAESDASILISGPQGSGKEVLARAIHAASARAAQPFVVLGSGEFPAEMTDASAVRQMLASAKGGCLFLDEIGALSPQMQAHLLPLVMEQGPWTARPAREVFDVRIIAAASQPMDNAIRDGRFRADLFYALGKLTLTVPPLSSRREDIPALVVHFVRQSQAAEKEFSPESMSTLYEAEWPGNVRQLRSVVVQALSQSVTPLVPDTLVRRLLKEERSMEIDAFDEARRTFEYNYLVALLESTGGNVTRAAGVAQRNRTEFYKLLGRHNINPSIFK